MRNLKPLSMCRWTAHLVGSYRVKPNIHADQPGVRSTGSNPAFEQSLHGCATSAMVCKKQRERDREREREREREKERERERERQLNSATTQKVAERNHQDNKKRAVGDGKIQTCSTRFKSGSMWQIHANPIGTIAFWNPVPFYTQTMYSTGYPMSDPDPEQDDCLDGTLFRTITFLVKTNTKNNKTNITYMVFLCIIIHRPFV